MTGKSLKNNQEDHFDEFLEGFGAEISPLDMFQRTVQNVLIQLFKPTYTNEIYEKLKKGICEICDEQFDSEHECSHKGYSLLILHHIIKKEINQGKRKWIVGFCCISNDVIQNVIMFFILRVDQVLLSPSLFSKGDIFSPQKNIFTPFSCFDPFISQVHSPFFVNPKLIFRTE